MSIEDKGIAEARERLRRKAQNEATVFALNRLLTLERQTVNSLREQLTEATARAERAEAELKKAMEPVATVYIGSGHCKIAFTDAAKEAMKGRQGQSFDVYGSTMPRAVKESLTVESVAAQVPQEWRDVMAEIAADLQAACDAEYPHREQYPSVMRKYQNDMAIVERARALLQEVKP